MTYEEAVKQLQTLAIKKGIDYRLDRLKPVLKDLGNPEQQLNKIIHVAGTNGKGSTIAFMQAICQEAGYSVGTFTSPHLVSYTERIALNGIPISEQDFCDLFDQCKDCMKNGLTEFETLTMMALLYFYKKKPAICLVEVGLGGRLDATNIIIPNCSVITQIDYDHQAILGDTLDKIAQEKAGIIKKNIPIVTTNQQDLVSLNVIDKKAIEKEAPIWMEAPVAVESDWLLQGKHQGINASLALRAIKIVFPNIDEDAVKRGVKKAVSWGRFTNLKYNNQTVIIDGAHNVQGLKSLRDNLKRYHNTKSVSVIFGIHCSKPLHIMIPIIKTLGDTFYYCEFDKTLAHKKESVSDYFNASLPLYTLGEDMPESPLIVITGSIYFIGNFYKTKRAINIF